MAEPPATILQLGAGRFLRGFVDRFVQDANDQGQAVGGVVVVQSTPGPRADLLNEQGGSYHVLIRGRLDGDLIDRVRPVSSIRRALTASTDWNRVLDLARDPTLRWVISNATEAGYRPVPDDGPESRPPRSLVGKFVQILRARYESGGPPLVVLPCELVDRNADNARQLATEMAESWGLSAEFRDWMRDDCWWLNSLVDCIITDGPPDHPLAESDRLLICAEPYALWAIERAGPGEPPMFQHPAIRLVDDLSPYFLRKVRVLNGLHTSMVARFLPMGFETVGDVMADPDASAWLTGLALDEIVPTLVNEAENVGEFALQTLERFRNPFQAHKLRDISLHQAEKVEVRLRPTFERYRELYGRPPRRLAEVLA